MEDTSWQRSRAGKRRGDGIGKGERERGREGKERQNGGEIEERREGKQKGGKRQEKKGNMEDKMMEGEMGGRGDEVHITGFHTEGGGGAHGDPPPEIGNIF